MKCLHGDLSLSPRTHIFKEADVLETNLNGGAGGGDRRPLGLKRESSGGRVFRTGGASKIVLLPIGVHHVKVVFALFNC